MPKRNDDIPAKKNSHFRFEEATHTYLLTGKPIPSVTQIIKPLLDYGHVRKDIIETAATRGTYVHKAIKLWTQGILDETTISPGIQPYFDGFLKWQAEAIGFPIQTALVEIPAYHKTLGYAGTPDIVTWDDSEGIIIDVKTRELIPEYDILQLVGYEGLMKIHFQVERWRLVILSLPGNGEYEWHEFGLTKLGWSRAWGMFRKLLDSHKLVEDVNAKINQWKQHSKGGKR